MIPNDVTPSSESDGRPARAPLRPATATATPRSPDEVEAILVERARILARPAEDSAESEATLDVVPFRLSEEQYAVDAQAVREVIYRPDVTPIPNTPGFLSGVYNLRGEILAVMDLRAFLNVAADGPIDEWLIVCGRDRNEFGIVADAVSEVRALPLAAVLKPRTTTAGAGLIRGVTRDALIVLDGDALIQDERLYLKRVET